MYDVHVIFSDMPGELARATARPSRRGAGGGGVFGTDAHFLVEDEKRVLMEAGLPCRRCASLTSRRCWRHAGVYPYPVQRPCESPYSADG
jgi:hypothetical protein